MFIPSSRATKLCDECFNKARNKRNYNLNQMKCSNCKSILTKKSYSQGKILCQNCYKYKKAGGKLPTLKYIKGLKLIGKWKII